MTETKREVEVLQPGLTARSLGIAIPLALIYAFLSCILGIYTDKPGTFGTFIIPMIYLVIVFELLGRASPKLRLTPQEYVFMFTIFCFLGMHSYLTMHAAAHRNPIEYFPLQFVLSDYLAFTIDSLKNFWSQSVPAVFLPPEPLRFEVATIMWNGRSPGQPIPWNGLTGPIVYWGLAILFYGFISMWVTFVFGKPWVEEERLVFPLAVPSLYLFREAGEVSGGGNKSRLFDFSLPSTKVFWAMFFVGVVSGINPIIAELFPAFPIGAWWGETKVDFPWLAAAWPGIYASAIFFIPQIAVGLVMPNDALITLILAWIIFGVLYQGIGVMTGTVPYNPGMEFVWPWEDYPGQWMPFPYRLIGATGVGLSIAVWMLVRYRRRFAETLSTLWRRDVVEGGLSLRLVTVLMLVGFFGWYALMLAEQADPLIALLVPVWAIIWNITYARVFAEVFWHVGTGMGYSWDLTYQIGAALRGWPTNYDAMWDNPNTNPAWMTINRNLSNFDNWNVSFSNMSASGMVTLYKLAHDTRMRMRDFLVGLIIGLVILAFVFIPMIVYFIFASKGGLSALGLGGTWWPWYAAGRAHRGRWVTSGLTPENALIWLWGFGLVLGLVLYVLKTRFTWFWFVNVPALYVGMTIPTYMWLTSLIALIIKYVAIRTVGMKRYEEYAVPVVAGWILGFGAAWLPAALVNMATVAVPRWAAIFQP